MVNKLDLRKVEKTIKNSGLKLFTSRELAALFGVSQNTMRLFVHRNTKKGEFTQIKHGLHALAENLPDPLYTANKLIQPSYVSLETALSLYNIIPETSAGITSVSTKSARVFEFKNTDYTYTKFKQDYFFGYELSNSFSKEEAFVATPEKALADYLYLVSIGKRKLNSRFNLGVVDKDKLIDTINKFNSAKLSRLVKTLYA